MEVTAVPAKKKDIDDYSYEEALREAYDQIPQSHPDFIGYDFSTIAVFEEFVEMCFSWAISQDPEFLRVSEIVRRKRDLLAVQDEPLSPVIDGYSFFHGTEQANPDMDVIEPRLQAREAYLSELESAIKLEKDALLRYRRMKARGEEPGADWTPPTGKRGRPPNAGDWLFCEPMLHLGVKPVAIWRMARTKPVITTGQKAFLIFGETSKGGS